MDLDDMIWSAVRSVNTNRIARRGAFLHVPHETERREMRFELLVRPLPPETFSNVPREFSREDWARAIQAQDDGLRRAIARGMRPGPQIFPLFGSSAEELDLLAEAYGVTRETAEPWQVAVGDTRTRAEIHADAERFTRALERLNPHVFGTAANPPPMAAVAARAVLDDLCCGGTRLRAGCEYHDPALQGGV